MNREQHSDDYISLGPKRPTEGKPSVGGPFTHLWSIESGPTELPSPHILS
jgi:hypothetical protein